MRRRKHATRGLDRRARRRSRADDAACRLAALGYTLDEIAAHRSTPSAMTLRRWRADDRAFRAAYDGARAARRQAVAESVVAIADAANRATLTRARLCIKARKWLVAAMEMEMDKEAARREGADRRREEPDTPGARSRAAGKRSAINGPRPRHGARRRSRRGTGSASKNGGERVRP